MTSDARPPVEPPQRDLSFMRQNNPLSKVASTSVDTTEGTRDDRGATPPATEPTRRRSSAPPRKPITGDPYSKVQRTVYLPLDLHRRVLTTAKDHGLTHGRIVLDAIAAHHKDLPRLVQEDRAGEIVPGDLWDEVVPQREVASGPKKALNFQVTNQQAAVIDELIESCDALDRTHLVTVALNAHLQESA